jgi:hypothetical protein
VRKQLVQDFDGTLRELYTAGIPGHRVLFAAGVRDHGHGAAGDHESLGDPMVEAGGVEPPSEKARREENYVRIRLMVFDLRFRAGEGGEGLVRLISTAGSGPKPLAYPAK